MERISGIRCGRCWQRPIFAVGFGDRELEKRRGEAGNRRSNGRPLSMSSYVLDVIVAVPFESDSPVICENQPLQASCVEMEGENIALC